MPAQITAVLDRAMLQQLLEELTPLKIRLGEDGPPERYFNIGRPTLVAFIPGRGVRIVTSAHAQWTLAGLTIPLTVESATLLLEPSIAPPPEPGKLVFQLKLEALDLKNVPDFVESKLLPLVNEALARFDQPLGWNFAKTLGARLAIPPEAAPLEAFTLAAGASSLEVTAEALVMKLGLEMHFARAAESVGVPTVGTPTNTPG